MKLSLKILNKSLNLKKLVYFPENDEIIIESKSINRVGLELTGFVSSEHSKRLVILGQKEDLYLSSLAKEEAEKKVKNFFKINFPAAIITKEFQKNKSLLISLCETIKKPLLQYPLQTNDLITNIIPLLNRWFAESTTLHGCVVNVFGKGIILLGESGIGKSEITLSLMKKNHFFVSDDQIILKNINNELIATAPAILEKLIEIRGVGVVDITQMFGHQFYMRETKIDLVIQLQDLNNFQGDRLSTFIEKTNYLGIDVRLIHLPMSNGRNPSDLIEAAVINMKLIEEKLDGNAELQKRTLKALNE